MIPPFRISSLCSRCRFYLFLVYRPGVAIVYDVGGIFDGNMFFKPIKSCGR